MISYNKNNNQKVLVDFLTKTWEILNVSKECFDNSNNIEEVGFMVGFKINSIDELRYRVKELSLKNIFLKEVVK